MDSPIPLRRSGNGSVLAGSGETDEIVPEPSREGGIRAYVQVAVVPDDYPGFFVAVKEGIDAVEGAPLAAAPEQEVSVATGQGEGVVPFSRLLDSGDKLLRQGVESYD